MWKKTQEKSPHFFRDGGQSWRGRSQEEETKGEAAPIFQSSLILVDALEVFFLHIDSLKSWENWHAAGENRFAAAAHEAIDILQQSISSEVERTLNKLKVFSGKLLSDVHVSLPKVGRKTPQSLVT